MTHPLAAHLAALGDAVRPFESLQQPTPVAVLEPLVTPLLAGHPDDLADLLRNPNVGACVSSMLFVTSWATCRAAPIATPATTANAIWDAVWQVAREVYLRVPTWTTLPHLAAYIDARLVELLDDESDDPVVLVGPSPV